MILPDTELTATRKTNKIICVVNPLIFDVDEFEPYVMKSFFSERQ